MSLTIPVSCISDTSSSYRVSFLFDLLKLLSFDELDLFDDESEDDGSGSRSPGTCNFPFCSGNFVVSFSGLGSGIFVPTGIESIGDIVLLFMFIPRVVDSLEYFHLVESLG